MDVWLRLGWKDNRIQVDSHNNTTRRASYMAENSTIIILQNGEIIKHLWVPKLFIRNQNLVKTDHGLVLMNEAVGVIKKNKDIWVDYWGVIKPTITCPMSFNWFPFDKQKCYFSIMVSANSPLDL